MSLAAQHCTPCEGTEKPLSRDEAGVFLRQVPKWRLDGDRIVRDIKRKDFADALDLVNAIGGLAEQEGHHPDLLIYDYKHVRITLSTHAIGGLSENDFILAAKIDDLSHRRN